MTATIAIYGATGNQGGSVARSLLQNPSFRVRAITRNPSSENSLALASFGAVVTKSVRTVQYALVTGDAVYEMRSFFAISMYHTHCDAFSRFRQFWDNHLRGADVANIHLVEQAVISGALDTTITVTPAVPFNGCRANSDVSRSPTQVVLAAWAMALAKTSGVQDITFGLCRHGRSSHSFPDVWRVMRPLINGLPFRISVQREETVMALLQRVQDEITTTRKWEHGFASCMFPSADGRPWVQSLINIKPELQGMEYTSGLSEDESTMTKMLPRPDFDKFVVKKHWAVLLAIKPHDPLLNSRGRER